MDVHRDSISVGVLLPDREVPEVERIAHDEASVRRLVGRVGEPGRLRACYEAGPTVVSTLPSARCTKGLAKCRRSRDRARARRVRVGRDDRGEPDCSGPRHVVGDATMITIALACRRAAVAGKIPGKSARSHTKGREHSEGRHPAYARTAVSTRELQSGGAPTPLASTRQDEPRPRPPPIEAATTAATTLTVNTETGVTNRTCAPINPTKTT